MWYRGDIPTHESRESARTVHDLRLTGASRCRLRQGHRHESNACRVWISGLPDTGADHLTPNSPVTRSGDDVARGHSSLKVDVTFRDIDNPGTEVIGGTKACSVCGKTRWCARTTTFVCSHTRARLGPADDFGPGIVDITESDVDLRLDAPGYVVALRVTGEFGVQVVAPVSGSPRSKRGTHYFRGGALSVADTATRTVSSKSCTVRADSATRAWGCRRGTTSPNSSRRRADRCTWILVTHRFGCADTASDVMRRLGLMNLAYLALEDLVRSIPEPLIDSRTTHWAAYYAPFGGASIP